MPSFRIQPLWLALPLMLASAAPALAAADSAPIANRPIGAAPSPAPTVEPALLPEALDWQGADAAPPPDGKIHGMVSASVGTNGYRQGSLALSGPLPNGGSIAIAVDAAQIDSGRGHRDRAPATAN